MVLEGSRVMYGGRDLLREPRQNLQRIRGKEISMIFQEPMTSLNPVFTVGEQICEVLRLHMGLSRAQARARAIEVPERSRHPRAAAARQFLSAPALRRPAAARHDRDGDRLRTQAADRRRADHGARCHHPEADPGTAGRSEAAPPHVVAVHHPRSGAGRRDCGPRRGDAGRRDSRIGDRWPTFSSARSTPTPERCSSAGRAWTGGRSACR